MAVAGPTRRTASIEFGGRRIAFTVDFGRRRHMYLTVHPDLSVVVKVPRNTPAADVQRFVLSRGNWVLKHILRYESLSPVMLDQPYVHGALHRYLGREIRLDLAPGLFDSVKLVRDKLAVNCAQWRDETQVGELVEEWFLDRALLYLPQRLEHWFAVAVDVLRADYPELRIGYMKRCWGTSSKRGWVHLNSELIKVAPECGDYVVVHELCHLRVREHDKRFYGLVEAIMPDWRRRSRLLERYVI